MAEPIKIVVTAETAEAAAKLEAFMSGAGSGLKGMAAGSAAAGGELTKLRETAMLTHEGFRGLEGSAMLLAGQRFPELAVSAMLLTDGLRLLRTSAMLAGVSLAAVLPYAVAIGAVVGAGVLAWHEYASAETEAAAASKDLTDALDKVPAILEKISLYQKSGLLSPAAAEKMRGELEQRKSNPLFVGQDGNVTTEATSTVERPTFANGTFAPVQTGTEQVQVQNRAATQAEIGAFENQKLALSGEQVKALAEFGELTKKAPPRRSPPSMRSMRRSARRSNPPPRWPARR
jgi:hypothetical protein